MEHAQTKTRPQTSSLWKATSVFASMTMLSRILGFIRDTVTAHLFGASLGTDAFFVAFKIPNFMRRLFAEGAFSQAFVPILSEYHHQRTVDETRQFISRVAGMLSVCLLGLTLFAVIAAPWLIRVFAPGFEAGSERFIWAGDMLRITFPYLFFISLAAFAGAILNTHGQFGPPAFTPVLLNLAMIATAYGLSPWVNPPITALAWGVFLGGILQLVWQIPHLYRLNMLPAPQFYPKDPGVKRVLKQMVPALFGVSVSQINLLFDTLFASFLPIGSVSWLYFSDRVTSLPLGVFGVALATVILPHLSRKHVEQSIESFSHTLNWALRNILLIAVPSTVGLIILGQPLIIALFHYGKFTAHDVTMTYYSLMAFAAGIPAFMAVKVLASAFYATQNIRTPVRIAAIAMITNLILNFILIHWIAHAGLALATSLAAYLNAFLLWFHLHRRNLFLLNKGWIKFSIQLIFANVLMGIFLYYFAQHSEQWLQWASWKRLIVLALILGGSFLFYFGSLFLSGYRFHKHTFIKNS